MSKVVEQEEVVDVAENEVLAEPTEETTQASPEQVPEEPKIPEKFQGKGIEDVVQSYENLEKEFGKRNNELGELRKLTDQLLELQLSKEGTKETPKEIEEPKGVDLDTLLDNPTDAVNQLIESNPRLKAIEQKLQQEQQLQVRSKLDERHPNWEVTASTPEFQNWVAESKARTMMFQTAHQTYDYDLAGELFDMYSGRAEGKPAKPKEEMKKAVEKQTTESGSTGNAPTKVYRRADLINLKLTDPNKYEAMEDDILLAYAQGRVR